MNERPSSQQDHEQAEGGAVIDKVAQSRGDELRRHYDELHGFPEDGREPKPSKSGPSLGDRILRRGELNEAREHLSIDAERWRDGIKALMDEPKQNDDAWTISLRALEVKTAPLRARAIELYGEDKIPEEVRSALSSYYRTEGWDSEAR